MVGAQFNPKILAFLCQWCSYSGADAAGRSKLPYPPNVHVVRVPCSSRVDPTFVLKGLAQGMDGVLVCGCHPGDCHYHNGNYKTLGRMKLLQKMLTDLGLEPERLRLEWISATEGNRYARVVKEMTETIMSLGPLNFTSPVPNKGQSHE